MEGLIREKILVYKMSFPRVVELRYDTKHSSGELAIYGIDGILHYLGSGYGLQTKVNVWIKHNRVDVIFLGDNKIYPISIHVSDKDTKFIIIYRRDYEDLSQSYINIIPERLVQFYGNA